MGSTGALRNATAPLSEPKMPTPDNAAAAATATNWDDLRLWGAFAISVASLLWSERNRRASNRATRNLRRQTIKLEEFRSVVKGPLLEALVDCEDVATKAESIGHSGKPLDELKPNIEELNRAAIEALSKVESRLNDANDSAFADGADWLDDFDTLEDQILALFNEASNTVNGDQRRRHALLKIKTNIGRLRTMLKTRIDNQINAISTTV